jgi:transcriptional regulator with XRE-family HTH domain
VTCAEPRVRALKDPVCYVASVHHDGAELARLLREVKDAAGLTDQDVADAAGVDRSQAWRWSRGTGRPGYEPLRRLTAWLTGNRPAVAGLALRLLPAAGYETEPPALPPPDDGVRAALYQALAVVNAPLREQVLAEARSGAPFADPVERVIWERAEFTPEERAEEIAGLRARRSSSRRSAAG